MKPKCWDAICYLAGTTRGGDRSVTLSQSDCRELTAYVIQLTARGMAERGPSPLSEEPRGDDDAAHRMAMLDSHVCELIELLKYDGKENLVSDVALTGESLDRYQERTSRSHRGCP